MGQSIKNIELRKGLAENINYPIYLHNHDQRIVFELLNDHEINYIQVVKYKSGAFRHHRGKTFFRTRKERDDHLSNCDRCGEQRWIQAYKDYFGIDKKVREEFIKKYEL